MKKNIVLLHGALGASKQLKPLADALSESFNVHTFNFEGHGGTPTSSPYSIQLFSQNLTDFLEENDLLGCDIFGYSMGGYVAMHAAAHGTSIGKIITLGTKLDWTVEGAQREVRMLNPEIIEDKIPKYAEYQAQLHAPSDWKQVMHETANMMLRLGENPALKTENFKSIQQKVLLTLGTEDNMVTREETLNVVDLIPHASFHSFEGFQHPIEKVSLPSLVEKIADFLS